MLDEIKYRKCEEIFDNLQINEKMYMQAYKNVMEIQRIEKDIKNNGENFMYDNQVDLKGLSFIWNKIKNNGFFSNISKLMKENFYFLSISLVILSITIIASQINQK